MFTLGLLALASPVAAQAIGGRVTDSSGAVLPGVTVETSSPALIERSRQVVTDGQGRYLLTELRPGVYQVTFSLSGFAQVVRTGIELTSGFTATVNVELSVGAVEESVTVSGTSPVVDVQSVQTTAVTTREVIDAIPTGRNVEAFGRLIPGSGSVTGGGNAYTPDVGGSTAMQQIPLAFRGNSNTIQMVDGFRTSIATSTQFSGDYFNSGMIQEVAYTTSGDSAEATGGGMKVNIVPKDGGNAFSGSAYGVFTYSGWAWQNVDDELRARGLTNAADILKIWDFNPTYGGPIKRNTLWFQATYRNWGVDKTVPGSFSEITGEPGHDGGHINSGVLRLTWQVNQKNKIAAMYTRPPKYRSNWGIAGSISPEATAVRTDPMIYHGFVKWTATPTSKLLLQAGFGDYNQQYTEWYQEAQVTASGLVLRSFPITGARYDPYFSNIDLITGHQVGSYSGGFTRSYTQLANYVASAAYVTGSHSIKIGLDVADIQGRQSQVRRGDMQIRWRNGAPDSAILYASPRYAIENLLDVGAYAQDQWTFSRFTVNGGIRYETYNGSVPEQWNPAGSWVAARLTQPVNNIPKWKDLSPRGGVSWDVRGNGSAAVKFSIGRYAAVPMTSLTSANNPMRTIVYSATARWLGDTNANRIPDKNELGALDNQYFGTDRPSTTYDPDVLEGFGKRPYNWDVALTLQHELRSGLGVEASVYRRNYFNQVLTDNRAIGPLDFDEYEVVVPSESRLPDGGGQRISGLYVIKDASRPLSDSYTTFADKLGDYREWYNGADFTVNWRGPNGSRLAGGVDWGQAYIDSCFVVDSPQLLDCRRPVDPSSGAVRGGVSLKLLGSMPLSGWQISSTVQSSRGPEILANWTTRDGDGTLRFTSTNRANLGATPNVVIPIIRPGTAYDDRYFQLDLRGSRFLRLGSLVDRLKVNVDLYNVLNGNMVIRRNNNFGASWGTPVNILEGRLFELGAQIDF
jgi:hypothetical protein